MSVLDEVYKLQQRRQNHLLPPVQYYKLSPDTLVRIVGEQSWPEVGPLWDGPLGREGRFWGIPFVLSAGVPADTILFTTDFERWQKLTVAP
jgi:hypothetical protein